MVSSNILTVETPTTLLDMTRARNIGTRYIYLFYIVHYYYYYLFYCDLFPGIFLAGFHLPLEEIDDKLNKIDSNEELGLDSNQIVALKRLAINV